MTHHTTHHATHHAVPPFVRRSAWLARRRRWHALHHSTTAEGAQPGHHGVSSSLWDSVFGTRDAAPLARRKP